MSRQQRWQAKKIAEGLCATCGHRARRDGFRQCDVCAMKGRAYQKRRYSLLTVRKEER